MLQALGANRTAEAQRGKTDTNPGELVRDADDILQPGPQLAGADVARAEAEAADDGGSQHGDPGHVEAVQGAEESGRVPVDGESV